MTNAVSLGTHALAMADGQQLAVYTLGEGPPVLLLHGFLSNAQLNWIGPGIAAAIAAAGFSVIAPDFRGHGRSAAPDDPRFYPPDVLAADTEAVQAAFQTQGCIIVGYSLGARIAARMIARGAQPKALVLAGMGLRGLTDIAFRQAHFEDAIRNGPNAANPQAGAFIQNFMAAQGIRPGPALAALNSQLNTPIAALRAITCPTLVLCGERDQDNGSAEELASAIPGAQLVRPSGDHLSTVGKPDFRDSLIAFLRA